MRLNLGCSDRHMPGFVNVDIVPPADVLADLSLEPGLRNPKDLLLCGWDTWEDSSIESIVAHDIIEHLPDKILTMNQIWRVLVPGGTADIVVPTTDGAGAWQDPGHVSFWNRNSFWYYTDGDPHRERFGSSYGITARFRVLREELVRGKGIYSDIVHLNIVLEAVKTRGRSMGINPDVVNALNQGGAPQVLGLMRIKNESRWIRRSIESQLPICDKILVLDDHSTDDTRDIVRSFGERCLCVESRFVGVSEGRDKRFLLAHAVAVAPEWVLWIDGDEVLDQQAPEAFRIERAAERVAWYALPMLYFWDSENTIRVDGIYETIHRGSLFRVRGQDLEHLTIPHGTGAADLHNNGNCPMGLRGEGRRSNMRIKHYGYLDKEERERKFQFYNQLDPNNESEDCYRHIIETPGARHAPGPTVLRPWVE